MANKRFRETKLLGRLALIVLLVLAAVIGAVRLAGWLSARFHPAGGSANVAGFGTHLPSGYSVHGIDVSKHQGAIDWQKVSLAKDGKAGISFAFIKATEGITRQDEKFGTNWRQAGKNKVMRGAYHFFYPSRDAKLQALNFISMVELAPGDLPPVVDIEHSNSVPAAEIERSLKVFLDELEKHYHVKPLIYTNINFYNRFLKRSFGRYPLWISCYFGHDRFYSEFAEPWVFWQHSEQGRVDGIRGSVDLNVFNGSSNELARWCLR